MSNQLKNNRLLIIELKKGNEKAYIQLVDNFYNKLCVYANSLVNDVAITDDIVQNVFIKVWERRKNLKEGFSIQNFLYKSVYNEFIDYYRKRQHLISLDKIHINTLEAYVEERNNHKIEKMNILVKSIIQDLPEKCKQIFILSKKEGLTNVEISEYLGVSIKTVEYHITNAFSTIKSKINQKNSILP